MLRNNGKLQRCMFSILKICYAFQGEESCAEPVSTCARLRSASSSGTFPCLARNDAAMLLYNWLPFEINALLALLPSRLPRLGTVHELRALSITTSNQARGWVSVSSAMQATADDGHVLVPCRCPSFVCHVQDILREARGCSILGLDRTVWIFLLGHGGGVALMLFTDTDLRFRVSGISTRPAPFSRLLQSLQVPP